RDPDRRWALGADPGDHDRRRLLLRQRRGRLRQVGPERAGGRRPAVAEDHRAHCRWDELVARRAAGGLVPRALDSSNYRRSLTPVAVCNALAPAGSAALVAPAQLFRELAHLTAI